MHRFSAYKYPVIFAGYGVESAGARDAFRAMVDKLQIPVLLTWKAIDLLPEDHPCYCGRPGSIGQRAANIIIQKADLIICIGARLDPDTVGFNYDDWGRNADIYVHDVDANERKKLPARYNFLCEDAAFACERLERIDRLDRPDAWLSWCKSLYARFSVEYQPTDEGVDIYRLIEEISNCATADDVIAVGSSGPAANILLQTWKVKERQRVLNASVIGAMGVDIPGAIGACLASGGKRTICVTGDGGFMLNIQELEVVRRLNLPIKFFVCCNGGYGSIANMQDKYFNRRVGADRGSGFTLPDIERIVDSFDIDSEVCDVEWVLRNNNPEVICVRTPLLQQQAPRVMTKLVNGQPVTQPYENLFPFMSEDELSGLMKQQPRYGYYPVTQTDPITGLTSSNERERW